MARKIKNISTKNQTLLDETEKLGFGFNHLIKKYGARFTLKLIRSLTSPKKIHSETTSLISPKFKVSEKNQSAAWTEYVEMLKDAGFKFHEWMEDFVDEDTGETVSIERFEVYYIGYGK